MNICKQYKTVSFSLLIITCISLFSWIYPSFVQYVHRGTTCKSCDDGQLLTGDFNQLNNNSLLSHFQLKQIAKVLTRNNATLDLCLTNLHEDYNSLQALPPFGLSDHNTIVISTKIKDRNGIKKKMVIKQDRRANDRAELGRYLSSINCASIQLNIKPY